MKCIYFIMNFAYFTYFMSTCVVVSSIIVNEDILSPFANHDIETKRKNRLGKNLEMILQNKVKDSYTVSSFRSKIGGDILYGHRAVVYNPRTMFSVLEPLHEGGCKKKRQGTVLQSSKQRKCLVAINAGFFRKNTKECFGNVVSDGDVVNLFNSGVNSVNFGVRRDGSLVIGIMTGSYVLESIKKNPFIQMVTGFGWVLRNGYSYINESLEAEKCNAFDGIFYAGVKTARTFLGFDANGYVHVVQVDGRSGEKGLSLYDAAEFLRSLGIMNAINLDGGGSATFVANQVVVNYPSNICLQDGEESLCSRKVSTVLCIHEPNKCNDDRNCSSHGYCRHGACMCDHGWYDDHCSSNGSELTSDWVLYYVVLLLTVIIGILLVTIVFLCNLYVVHRNRCIELRRPPAQKDRLRSYLLSNRLLSSEDEDGDYDMDVPQETPQESLLNSPKSGKSLLAHSDNKDAHLMNGETPFFTTEA